MANPAESDALTPSEVVLVHGEAFARRAKGSHRLPGGTEVNSRDAAYAAAQAAILANEAAGALVVEPGTEKRFFGLMTAKVVRLRGGAQAPAWPAGTLEARVHEVVAAAGEPRGITLNALFLAFFPTTVLLPWTDLLEIVEGGLCARGLAETTVEVQKTLGIFKSQKRRVELTGAGRELAARHAPDEAKALLGRMERERPELWTRFGKELRQGLDAREDTRDYGGSSSD